eukprot:319010-Chlamydomonas_euryale.AAC.2
MQSWSIRVKRVWHQSPEGLQRTGTDGARMAVPIDRQSSRDASASESGFPKPPYTHSFHQFILKSAKRPQKVEKRAWAAPNRSPDALPSEPLARRRTPTQAHTQHIADTSCPLQAARHLLPLASSHPPRLPASCGREHACRPQRAPPRRTCCSFAAICGEAAPCACPAWSTPRKCAMSKSQPGGCCLRYEPKCDITPSSTVCKSSTLNDGKGWAPALNAHGAICHHVSSPMHTQRRLCPGRIACSSRLSSEMAGAAKLLPMSRNVGRLPCGGRLKRAAH